MRGNSRQPYATAVHAPLKAWKGVFVYGDGERGEGKRRLYRAFSESSTAHSVYVC